MPVVRGDLFSLSDAWIYIETAGLDERFFIRSLDAIRGITREEIRILAQKYFCKENLIEVIAGKKSVITYHVQR
mgnify:CR=1 FL=1